MWVIVKLNETKEVDCFKYLWLQVAADGGCVKD